MIDYIILGMFVACLILGIYIFKKNNCFWKEADIVYKQLKVIQSREVGKEIIDNLEKHSFMFIHDQHIRHLKYFLMGKFPYFQNDYEL